MNYLNYLILTCSIFTHTNNLLPLTRTAFLFLFRDRANGVLLYLQTSCATIINLVTDTETYIQLLQLSYQTATFLCIA